MTSGFRVAGPRRLGLWLLPAVAAGLLAGCVEMRNAAETRAARALLGTGPQATQGAFALAPNSTATLTDPEMEPDPGAFSVAETVAWDGERTLQGVWIAHPEAESARRVRIVNMQTGAAVDGALFRREAGLPGPEVLVSSDAAVALGLAPDVPVPLEITAIRFAPPAPALAAAEGATASDAAPSGEAAAPAEAAGETAPDPVAVEDGEVQPTAAVTPPGAEPGAGPDKPEAAPGTAPAGEAAAEARAAEPAAPEPDRMRAANLVTPEMQAGLSQSSVRRRPAAAMQAAADPQDPDPAGAAAAAGEAPASAAALRGAAPEADRPDPSDAGAAPEQVSDAADGAGPRDTTQAEAAPAAESAAPDGGVAPDGAPAAQAPGGPVADGAAGDVATGRDAAPAETPAAAPAAIAGDPAPETVAGTGIASPDGAGAASPSDTEAAAGTGAAAEPAAEAGDAAGTARAAQAPAPTARARDAAQSDVAADARLARAAPVDGHDPAADRPDRPFVQAGIFSVTENAERLVARFREAGYPAQGKPMTYRGKPAIRVVAGPFETEAALADALRTLRRIGPSDAVPVRK